MKKPFLFPAIVMLLVSACQKKDASPHSGSSDRGKYLVKTTNVNDINRYTEYEYDRGLQLLSATSYYPDGNIQRVGAVVQPGYGLSGELLLLSHNYRANLSYRFEYQQDRLARAYDYSAAGAQGVSYDSIGYGPQGIKYVFRKTARLNVLTLDSAILLDWSPEGNILGIYTGSVHDSANLRTAYRHKIIFSYAPGKINPYLPIVIPLFWNQPEHYAFASKEAVIKKEFYRKESTTPYKVVQYDYHFDAAGYPATRTEKSGSNSGVLQEVEQLSFLYMPVK